MAESVTGLILLLTQVTGIVGRIADRSLADLPKTHRDYDDHD